MPMRKVALALDRYVAVTVLRSPILLALSFVQLIAWPAQRRPDAQRRRRHYFQHVGAGNCQLVRDDRASLRRMGVGGSETVSMACGVMFAGPSGDVSVVR